MIISYIRISMNDGWINQTIEIFILTIHHRSLGDLKFRIVQMKLNSNISGSHWMIILKIQGRYLVCSTSNFKTRIIGSVKLLIRIYEWKLFSNQYHLNFMDLVQIFPNRDKRNANIYQLISDFYLIPFSNVNVSFYSFIEPFANICIAFIKLNCIFDMQVEHTFD